MRSWGFPFGGHRGTTSSGASRHLPQRGRLLDSERAQGGRGALEETTSSVSASRCHLPLKRPALLPAGKRGFRARTAGVQGPQPPSGELKPPRALAMFCRSRVSGPHSRCAGPSAPFGGAHTAPRPGNVLPVAGFGPAQPVCRALSPLRGRSYRPAPWQCFAGRGFRARTAGVQGPQPPSGALIPRLASRGTGEGKAISTPL